MEKKIVVYYDKSAIYPSKDELFRPSESYPEYRYKKFISSTPNTVYGMVREAFRLMELDIDNFNTEKWNPLRDIVKPGNSVLLKPNLVLDKNLNGEGEECLYTHPSVVAAIIDYVIIALNGNGKIIVGDAPMQECMFDRMIIESGYAQLIDFYKWMKIDIELVDFRELSSIVKNGIHYQSINKNAKGHVVDLKNESEFSIYDKKHINNLRITNYDPTILSTHHQPGKHEYYISDYVLNADVVIGIPKPKTHRKAGVTISLKNMVGTNVRKEYLPHHCIGAKADGGDEYERKSRFKTIEAELLDHFNYAITHNHLKKAKILRVLKKINSQIIKLDTDKYREGSWYGNNTISKTITDLNKILLYADKNGNICNTKQRNLFIVADIIVSGEKEGPVQPSRKAVGIIAMGEEPVCFDEAIATIMGMDIRKIPTIYQVRNMTGKLKITQADSVAKIISNNVTWNNKKVSEIRPEDTLHFEPASGWKGHIELK